MIHSHRQQSEDPAMQYALFSLPIHTGCGQDARAFLEQLEWERKTQYAASERRLGITKEL